jgi:hypothetical protein
LPWGGALSPGSDLPVGGDCVVTVVALAELPPLTVWLGPPLLAPVVELPLSVPPPLPPSAVDGAADPPEGAGATVALGAVVIGATLEPVVVGVLLLLGAVSWPSLLQPDRRAMAAAADETAITAARYELFTGGKYPSNTASKPD